MSRRMRPTWSGLCPAGKHGLDYAGQPCDLCPAPPRDGVMKCPLCRRKLVIRYRVVEAFSRGSGWPGAPRPMIKRYHPIWWCAFHKFSVEINRRSSRRIVSKRPGTARTPPPAGSASGR